MSWLVAVSFPVLLMLCAVGMLRIETLLHGDRSSAANLVAQLERAARAAGQKAAERTAGELSAAKPLTRFDPLLLIDEPGLPTRPNPVFQPSG
ncbi:MAG: hypothetical protein KIH64_012150 [Mycobacterium sp.]|nr:hypothetical protein [Mycobacterium sp.]